MASASALKVVPTSFNYFDTGKPRIVAMDYEGKTIDDYVSYHDGNEDKYFRPHKFFPAEYVYNTRHGELPGHHQADFDENLTEPEADDYTLVRKPWAAKGDSPT